MNIKKITAVLLAGTIMATSLTGCGVSGAAAKLDNKEVSCELVNFMCKYQQALADDMYSAYAETYGDIWTQDLYGSGSSTWDQLVDSCVESVHELYTLQAHMDEYKVELTADEKEKITKVAKDFIEANSKDALKEMGASQELVEEMLTLYTIKSKMHEAIIADVDTTVSDEEANCKAYSYVKIEKGGHYNENSEYVEYTEEELADLAVYAEQIGKDAEDGISLEDIGEQYSLEVSTGTYDSDDESIDADLKTALDKLKEGQMTGLVDTESTYYVARLDSESDKDATEENRKSIVSKRQEDKYEEVLTGWQDAETWKVYDKKIDKIAIDNHFTLKNEASTEANTEATTE